MQKFENIVYNNLNFTLTFNFVLELEFSTFNIFVKGNYRFLSR